MRHPGKEAGVRQQRITRLPMCVPELTPTCAFFTDFDGTLVELTDSPDGVTVDPALPDLLRRACTRLEGALAVVSGRNVATLDGMLDHAVTAVAGVHGLERRDASGTFSVEKVPTALLDDARKELAGFARDRPGVLVEDKGVSLALHFRRAPDQAGACLAVMETMLRRGEGLMLQRGKMVVELRGAGHSKGDAVARFMAEPPFAGRLPVFIGDDVTDEDSFRVVNDRGGWSVRVGDARDSAARHSLPDVAAVHRWLKEFADG